MRAVLAPYQRRISAISAQYRLRPKAHTFRTALGSVRLAAPAVRRAYKTLLTSTDSCARSGGGSGARPIRVEFTILGRIVSNQPVSYHIDSIRRITVSYSIYRIRRIILYHAVSRRIDHISRINCIDCITRIIQYHAVSCSIRALWAMAQGWATGSWNLGAHVTT